MESRSAREYHVHLPTLQEEEEKSHTPFFALLYCCAQIAYVLLFGFLTEYSPEAKPSTPAYATANWGLVQAPFYSDIHVLLFIGFGFMFAVLKRYGYSSVGFTFFFGALIIQWAILINGFWDCVGYRDWSKSIPLDVKAFIRADFAAVSLMISLGAVLGKITAVQMFVIAVFQVFFYSLNKMIIERTLYVVDLGGSLGIHCFGAFFGLALSKVITRKNTKKHIRQGSVYHSDLFSLIGTIFLWVYFPSFNAALATTGPMMQRAIVNTVLCLSASCIAAFATSQAIRPGHRFHITDIQGATLAGAAGMGSAATMCVFPAGAISCGTCCGIVAVLGSVWVQPLLLKLIGLHDTLGIQNTFAWPSIIGGVCATIVAGSAKTKDYKTEMFKVFPAMRAGFSRGDQAGYEFAGLGVSLGMGLACGAITGLLVSAPIFLRKSMAWYSDRQHWKVQPFEDDEEIAAIATMTAKASIRAKGEESSAALAAPSKQQQQYSGVATTSKPVVQQQPAAAAPVPVTWMKPQSPQAHSTSSSSSSDDDAKGGIQMKELAPQPVQPAQPAAAQPVQAASVSKSGSGSGSGSGSASASGSASKSGSGSASHTASGSASRSVSGSASKSGSGSASHTASGSASRSVSGSGSGSGSASHSGSGSGSGSGSASGSGSGSKPSH